MGRRGPKPNIEAAKKSGQYRRDRHGKKASPPVALKVDIPPVPGRKELERIIGDGIPGYDPFVHSGNCRWDYEAAADVIAFFHEELRHVKGELARQPVKLEEWQMAIVANLFGWKRPDGTRRYRQAWLKIPRKNGKTVLAAGIILYLLFEDDEYGAEVYGCASTASQAALVFDWARGFVAQSERLRERARKVYAGQAKGVQLGEEEGLSTYRVVSGEPEHGWNTHGAVVDEVHQLPNDRLTEALETSVGGRRQPLLVYITTSDFDRESVCNKKDDYAHKVRDGIIEDPTLLPCIWEAAVEDDWRDEDVWAKANPNLGVSVKLDYMREACKKAQDEPSYEDTFRRLHLNVRTKQSQRWLSMDAWDACGQVVDPESLKGERCFGGLDLASVSDITAFVLLFPDVTPMAVMPFFWVPEDGVAARSRRGVPYSTWVNKGALRTTPGNVVDQEFVASEVMEVAKDYNVADIAFDRWGAQWIATKLMGEGFDVVLYGQGFKDLSPPSKELERLVMSERIAHGGHPVLRWMASNVAIDRDPADNIKPNKKKSSEKIDGIVSLVMALGRYLVSTDTSGSVYDGRGILTL